MRFTRKKFVLGVFTCFFLATLLTGAFHLHAKEMAAKITHITGECLVLRKGGKDWTKATVKMLLYAGDRLRTKLKAKVEIKFHDGSVIRLSELSDFEVKNVSKDDKTGENNIDVKTKKGNYWTKFKKSTAQTKLDQELPTAITGVRGTVYRISVDEDGKTVLRVYKGKVEVKTWLEAVEGQMVPKLKEDSGEKKGEKKQVGPPKEVTGPKEISMEEWIRTVEAMQQIVLYPDRAPEDPAKFDAEEDSKDPWVKWNKEMDALLEKEGE